MMRGTRKRLSFYAVKNTRNGVIAWFCIFTLRTRYVHVTYTLRTRYAHVTHTLRERNAHGTKTGVFISNQKNFAQIRKKSD